MYGRADKETFRLEKPSRDQEDVSKVPNRCLDHMTNTYHLLIYGDVPCCLSPTLSCDPTILANHRHRSSVNFRGARHFYPKKYMYV